MAILIANCFAVLTWLSSFIGRLVRVAPLQALASTLASLCSQVFQILAFLLPLKVMMLLGSSGIPSYFPRFFAGIERERLILWLAVTAVLLYLMHLLMDFFGAALARVGSSRLILLPEEGDEMLARQKKVALSLYRGAITVASGSLFTIGALIFLGVFNAQLLGVVLGYLVAAFLINALVLTWLPALLERAVAQFQRLIDVLSACGFLLVFGFLVMDFLYGEAKGLLLGILALLLCRQMFSRLAMALKRIERLYGHRERANRVLGGQAAEVFDDEFSGDLLERSDDPSGLLDGSDRGFILGRSESGRPPFWDMVAPKHSTAWVRETLRAAGVPTYATHIEQLDVGGKGELALQVTCGEPGQGAKHFLFKAFNRKESRRVHRATDLLALYPGEAAIRLRTVIERDGFAAHLYEWDEKAHLAESVESVHACREQAFIESCAWTPPEVLVGSRQSDSLVERCGPALWARCQAFSRWLDTDTQQLVDAFAAAPLRLQKALSALPLRLYNPDITLGNTYAVGSAMKALRWENWTLEPIGSGWPLELGLERLDRAFECACASSEELRRLSPLQVRLGALAFAFEERCARWAYLSAFALLGQLHETVEAMER